MEFNNSSGFPNDPTTGNPTLAKINDPVLIVTPGSFKINGNIGINGVIYSNNASVDNFGTGNATINGGIITCNNYNSNGNGTVAYSDLVIATLQRTTGVLVKVPGSWRDWQP